MALLTNPNTGDGKFTKLLINNGTFICILFYISGIAWFLSLAHRSFNDGTYFSENALLPGLVQGEFDEDITAKKLYLELTEIMHSNPHSIPFEWLLDKFNEMSIDAYLHNFTLNYPFVHNTTYHGQNVYAILRAPRSSSIEGLIITAPFRTISSAHPDNKASISLMLALAKFCRRHKYWAKDIIFLITDHEQLGTQAWLEAYHNIQLGNGILKHGNIMGRAGSIQAAINLEFHSIKISHIDVKIEGLNGQLPNLDLVNLVHRLCKNEGIRHTFKNRAVTLEGFEPPDNYRKQVSGLYQAGRVLEGILRSLNNLLERFHQSYFFYLLPSNERFISIGTYMPSVSLIGAPLLIKALIIWLQIYSQIKPKTQDVKKEEKTKNVKPVTGAENKDQQLEKKKDKSEDDKRTTGIEIKDQQLTFTNIGLVLLLSHLLGWLFTISGTWLSQIGFELTGFSTKASIYVGFFIFFILSINISLFFTFSPIESNLLNIIALLELSTLLLIIAMHNFSLALILSVIYVPCVYFISAKCRWISRIVRSMYMILIHPFALVHVIVLIYTYVTQGEENLLSKALLATQHSYIYLIIDDMIYGNWFMKAIFGFLIPNWILFWTCLHS